MLQVRKLHGDLEVLVVPQDAAPSAEALRRVEKIWQQEKAKSGEALFNGSLFTVARNSGPRLEGRFVDYKWFLAQLRDPVLYADLGVRCLAVSGVLETDEGFVFGLRDGATNQDQGRWELVPSGGVSRSALAKNGQVSCQRQLLIELQEELGLHESEVTAPEVFILVEDSETHVIDIGLRVRSRLTGEELRQRFATTANREYMDLALVSRKQLPSFLASGKHKIVEVSRVLLQGCELNCGAAS